MSRELKPVAKPINSLKGEEKMNHGKGAWLTVFILITIAFVIDGVGHVFLPASPYMETWPPGLLSRAIGKMPAAMAYVYVLFLVLAVTFKGHYSRMTGSGTKRGLKFGLALGGLWLIAFFEATVTGSSFFHLDLIMGLNDSVPVFLIGWGLGWAFSRKIEPLHGSRRGTSLDASLLFIPFSYVVGRYLLYIFYPMEDNYFIRPVAAFIWTCCMAVWITIMYLLIEGTATSSHKKTALRFSIQIFGINWLLYNLFVPMVLKASFSEFLMRGLVDTLFILVGLSIYGLYNRRRFTTVREHGVENSAPFLAKNKTQ